MKLSPAQQVIIDKLHEGWTLKSGSGMDGTRPWLARVHNKKLDTINVSSASVLKLYKLGLLDFERQYPISRWRLKVEVKP